MSTEIIGLIQAVTLGLIGILGVWIKATKTQVTNTHKTNMRDDLDVIVKKIDDMHSDMAFTLGEHSARITNVERMIYTEPIKTVKGETNDLV